MWSTNHELVDEQGYAVAGNTPGRDLTVEKYRFQFHLRSSCALGTASPLQPKLL